MFLRAGLLALGLLIGSRLLGLLRETALAAAFGASGQGDVAVLMLTLPDWLAGVLASGALAYVMLPAWSARTPGEVAATQRRLAVALTVLGLIFVGAMALARHELLDLLAPGLQGELRRAGADALLWSAAAFPMALLASLWATRLQHERLFGPMYGANLVVNLVLIGVLVFLARAGGAADRAVTGLGFGLLAAMALRLVWLLGHLPRPPGADAGPHADGQVPLPALPIWLWAVLAAGLPLTLPFAARSIASGAGEGALATFNYAWKLVELPLMLAIQLVATLAFPAIARALARPDADVGSQEAADAVRPAFALAWTLACAAAAALIVGAPALAQLLFGWGRMDARAIATIAEWARIGAWGLLPQAVIAVALTVLAARRGMRSVVLAYALAIAALLTAAAFGVRSGGALMAGLNVALAGVACAAMLALGPALRRWLPLRAIVPASIALATCAAAASVTNAAGWPLALQLAAAAMAAAFTAALAWAFSTDLRQALRR